MEYVLEGQEITRICLDFAVTLMTGDGAELQIGEPFTLTEGERTDQVHPEQLATSDGSILGLVHQRITAATIEEQGGLTLQFSNGQILTCPPGAEYEAWTLVSRAGERMVSQPGGGLAHWPSG